MISMRTIFLCLAVSASTALACTGDESQAKEPVAATRDKARVEVATVQQEPFQSTAVLTGTTEADHVVHVSAEMPGRILSVGFDEGGEVTKGDTLLRVDARTDRVMLNQYRIQKDQAARDLARTKDLHGRGLATDADIERAEMSFKMASSGVRMSQTGLGKSAVVAPITGVVDTAHVKAGEYVNPGTPIATIVNYDLLLVDVPLPESMLLAARAGAPVQVRFPAIGRSARGGIRRVGVQANKETRTFPLYVEVQNPDRTLRPGLRAEVTFVTDDHPNAVLIPRDSVIEGLTERFVFVLDDGHAKRTVVTLGAGKADRVQVLTGLSAGDKLIAVGHRDLADGDEVMVLRADQ